MEIGSSYKVLKGGFVASSRLNRGAERLRGVRAQGVDTLPLLTS